MDVYDAHRAGYPGMGPIVEPEIAGPVVHDTGPGPDHLLAVIGARDARAALDAAARVVLADGRVTAWTVASRVGSGAVFLLLVTAVLRDRLFSGSAFLLVMFAFVPLILLEVLADRAVGFTPRRGRGWHSLALPGAFAVFVIAYLVLEPGVGWFIGVFAAAVVMHSAVPLVAWARSGRAGGPVAWPAGSQAFALLAVLDLVEVIAPDRLVALAGLDPTPGRKWLERLESEQSLYGGRRRGRLRGDQRVGLTVAGRDRLHRMRAELERLAAEVPVG